MKIKINEIKIGNRFRKDMGDLSSLVRSIKEIGLLQAIGISGDKKLILDKGGLKHINCLT